MSSVEPLSILIVVSTLAYSSYLDLKTREVPDKVWLISGGAGVALNLYLMTQPTPSSLVTYGIATGATAAVAFPLYFLGLYGGADAKALVVVAAAHPTVSLGVQTHGFTGLATYTNGILLSALLPLSLAVYNLGKILRGDDLFRGFEKEKRLRRVIACFIGTRSKRSRAMRFWSPMETGDDRDRRFVFHIGIDDLLPAERDDVWITPGIPLLVFFFAGYLVTLGYGDIIGVFLSLLFRQLA